MCKYNSNEMLLTALLCLRSRVELMDDISDINKENIIDELDNCIYLMILCNADRRKLISSYYTKLFL